MVEKVTKEEIKDTMFGLASNKASCPNGCSAIFFKKAWSVIGNDVMDGIKSFSNLGELLKKVN